MSASRAVSAGGSFTWGGGGGPPRTLKPRIFFRSRRRRGIRKDLLSFSSDCTAAPYFYGRFGDHNDLLVEEVLDLASSILFCPGCLAVAGRQTRQEHKLRVPSNVIESVQNRVFAGVSTLTEHRNTPDEKLRNPRCKPCKLDLKIVQENSTATTGRETRSSRNVHHRKLGSLATEKLVNCNRTEFRQVNHSRACRSTGRNVRFRGCLVQTSCHSKIK